MAPTTVLAAKGGSVYGPFNPKGEVGETEGMLRKLVELGLRVVYFGKYNRELPAGVIGVQPTHTRVKEYGVDPLCIPPGAQEADWAEDVEKLKEYDPVAFIHTSGYSPTFSWVHNPRGATIQQAAILYTAPMLAVIEQLRLPRIVVNTDPRTYPRDQEMSYGWDYVRPRVVLDQCDKEWTRVVGGKKYAIRSRYASCESWAWLPARQNQDLDPAVVVAHAHVNDGIKKSNWSRWGFLENRPKNLYVYGKGWENSQWQDIWEGVTDDPFELFNMHTCGPVVSHTPGFMTGKPFVMASQGCIPLFHENYDPDEHYMPMDHPLRLRDFRKQATDLHKCPRERSAARAWMKQTFKPRWKVLEDLVNDNFSWNEGYARTDS